MTSQRTQSQSSLGDLLDRPLFDDERAETLRRCDRQGLVVDVYRLQLGSLNADNYGTWQRIERKDLST